MEIERATPRTSISLPAVGMQMIAKKTLPPSSRLKIANGLKMRLHQHQGSALLVPVHGKYLRGAITSRRLPTTLHSCIKTSSWLLRPNAESTTASLFFTQLILRRSM